MKATQKLEKNSRQTWLAGVGIFDTGREKAVNTLDRLFVNSSALFNELLEKGEAVESQLQAKLEARNMLQDTLSALRAKLGLGSANREQQLEALSQRVDNLVEVVAKLAQQKAAEKKVAASTSVAPAGVAPAKAADTAEAPAKKAPAKAAAKPATSRASAKTTTTKTSAAKRTTTKTAATKAPAKPRTRKPAATKTTPATSAKKDNT